MNADSKARLSDRGPEAVKSALIKAACEMLAEFGPNAMSVRNVAIKAGVNHGQVHHYFGGKEGLIHAAAAKLAKDHYKNAHERAEGQTFPAPLTLGEDSEYLSAVVRLVLDGRLDVATRELESEESVPLAARRLLTRKYQDAQVPTEVKARLAIGAAIELGWAALEPYILQVADVDETEQQAVIEHAKCLARTFVQHITDQSEHE